MCGISGEMLRARGRIDLARFAARLHLLAPRGPDSRGVFVSDGAPGPASRVWRRTGPVGGSPLDVSGCPADLVANGRLALGAHRLAIVGRDVTGDQPLISVDGRFAIAFSGEIYNYREIRGDLIREGARFASETDTEVLLQAVARWGPSALGRLNGMWAAALWDSVERTLLLTRDDLGIKPLCYYLDDEILLFASELKVLLADPRVRSRGRVNRPSLAAYLAHRVVDHNDESWWSPVRHLPPGFTLTLRLDAPCATLRRAADCVGSGLDGGTAEPSPAEFRELLTREVEQRVPPDLPSVLLLSGGLDSSALAACAARAPGLGRVRLLTAVHEDPANDERPFARAVADRFHAVLEEVPIRGAATWEELGALFRILEEPPRWNVVPQWRMMQAIRERGVKVFIEGQGGDELFGGYPPLAQRAAACSALGEGRWGRAWTDARVVPLRGAAGWAGLIPARVRDLLGRGEGEFYWMRPEFLREQRDAVRDVWAQIVAAHRDPRLPGHVGTLMRSATLPYLLRVGDRLAGACSVEGRMPLLAQPLVRYLRRAPPSSLIRDGRTKVLLRQALSEDLPPEVRDRTSKQGFMPPSAPTTLAFLDLVEADRRGGRLRSEPYIRWEWVDRFSAHIRRDPQGWFYPLWQCVCVELWLRTVAEA